MDTPEKPIKRRTPPSPGPGARRADSIFSWILRAVFPLGALATAGAAITTGSALFTLHPAYPLLLGIVFALSGLLAWRFWRQPVNTPRRFNFLRALGLLASCAVYALVWWLAPFTAVGPALAAMHSDTTVNVTERANQIVLAPSGATSEVGVFFQPGARVDARAYAAVLRPLAENGHTVVIAKQPLGIAFLASGAFETARTDNPVVDRWVLGGHSLGGVLSSSTAQELSTNADQDLAGLLLFASYPATDLSGLDLAVLSISGSNDGLASPQSIEESRTLLSASTEFTVVAGGTHAYFGDYGVQPGDGYPQLSHDAARSQISQASVNFVDSLDK